MCSEVIGSVGSSIRDWNSPKGAADPIVSFAGGASF